MLSHLLRRCAVAALIALSSASAFCVDYQWYASEFVGDYDVNKSANLSAAGGVSFNKPTTLKTVPAAWGGGWTHQLNDPNFPNVTVCDINGDGIAVGYSTDEDGDHAVVWYEGEWHLIPDMGDHWDDLNDYSTELIIRPSRANRITEGGVILGDYLVHDHDMDSFCWTPFKYEVEGNVTPITGPWSATYNARGIDINEAETICVYVSDTDCTYAGTVGTSASLSFRAIGRFMLFCPATIRCNFLPWVA